MLRWRKRQEDVYVSAVSQGDKKNIDIFGDFNSHNKKENLSQIILPKN